MSNIKKLAAVGIGLALGTVFPKIAYGDEGKLWYYDGEETVCERVLFDDKMSIEKQLFILIAALTYNKCQDLPEGLKLSFVFYDEGEVFVEFNEVYKKMSEEEKNMFGEQISKTACSLQGVESIIIWGND